MGIKKIKNKILYTLIMPHQPSDLVIWGSEDKTKESSNVEGGSPSFFS